MATQTQHFKLSKDSKDDIFLLESWNNNMTIIEDELNKIHEKLSKS